MAANPKRIYKLAEYTVERKQDGWHFERSAHFGEKEEMRGPYSSLASLTLVIARQLRREIEKRDAPPAPEA